MQHSGVPASPFAMEQMRRDFEAAHIGPQQNGTPHWANEFEQPSAEDLSHMEASFQAPKPTGFDPADFERYAQRSQTGRTANPLIGSPGVINGYQRPMGMNYGGYGMGMGMGTMNRPYSPMSLQPQQPVEAQIKGKSRLVELDETDWEAQFAQLETDQQLPDAELNEEAATRAMEAELNQMDRSVPPQHVDRVSVESRFGDFEKTWEGIQAEMTRARRDFTNPEGFLETQHSGEFHDWEGFDASGINASLRDPSLGDYLFEEDNLFNASQDPFGEGVRIMDDGGNLSLAALAFEAAVQKDVNHVEAWTRLGAAQAQNEKESPAIRALEQALKLDPANLDALMGLAVSYTNEGYDTTAYRTLERWLSTKYPALAPPKGSLAENTTSDEFGFTDRHLLHERVTELFIKAAQLSPDPTTMDPDVQVGLGVLFYGAEEFEKAVDCFSAALHSSETGSTNAETANQRPLLWNRLGATLANSGRSEEAIQAYERALELNPNFVRARYNLGVSCINIGCFTEAAQHLLGALAMHGLVEREGREKARELAGGGPDGMGDDELDRMMRHNQSTNLYDTLRRVFGQMGRKDLSDKVVAGINVDIFRNEFDF